MSVVGIDIGNALCVVAAAGKGGVDVVLNEESKRETPACVAFGERQRFLGAAAASSAPGTTVVSQIKRFLGRPYDPALQRDHKTLFPDLRVTEDPQGYPLLHFKYRGEEISLSPTQLLGMLLGGLKRSAERHLLAPVSNCCIAVPAHFNDVQRRAVLHAAEIAGLRPLRLLHECSAAVLEYGIYRRDFPVDTAARAHIAAFVDVGHSATQVAIAEFWAGEARIIARAADPNLGGRDFDGVLFDHFAAKLIAENPDLDDAKSVRASARLRTSCEKVKKVLSANPEATLHIEGFMADKDASGLITREEFEQICDPLLARLRLPLQKALDDALAETGQKPEAVELIGSGSRVPAVVRVVAEVFQQEPRRTLNASECVGRGCALQAAMLSPAFRVKKFEIAENVPFTIDVLGKGIIPKSAIGSGGCPNRQQILTVGDQIPTNRQFIATIKENTLSFDLIYSDANANQLTPTISTCKVDDFDLTQSENAQLKINVKLDVNGTISVDSVIMSYEDGRSHHLEESTKDDSGMDIDNDSSPIDGGSQMHIDKDPSCHHIEINMNAVKLEDAQDASRTGDSTRLPKSEEHNKAVKTRISLREHLQEDPRVEAKSEFQVSFTEHIHGVFSAEELEKAKVMETQMAEWDKQVEETKDRKNSLESYVYEMRNKLRRKYKDFVTDSERGELIERLQQVENWLLYGEGEDAEYDAYTSKLKELKTLEDCIEECFRESSERGPAMEQLEYYINEFWVLAQDNKQQFSHIEKQEKTKVQHYCEDEMSWLQSRKEAQDRLLSFQKPVVTAAELRSRTEALYRFCMAILSKPPPPRPKSTIKDRMVRFVQGFGTERRQYLEDYPMQSQREAIQDLQSQDYYEEGFLEEGPRDPIQEPPHQQSQMYNGMVITGTSRDSHQSHNHSRRQTHRVGDVATGHQPHHGLKHGPRPPGRQARESEINGGMHSDVSSCGPHYMTPTRQSIASSKITGSTQRSNTHHHGSPRSSGIGEDRNQGREQQGSRPASSMSPYQAHALPIHPGSSMPYNMSLDPKEVDASAVPVLHQTHHDQGPYASGSHDSIYPTVGSPPIGYMYGPTDLVPQDSETMTEMRRREDITRHDRTAGQQAVSYNQAFGQPRRTGVGNI